MNLIATRQLRGEYGLVSSGQRFDARPELAADLLRRGLAKQCEVKVDIPPETKQKTPPQTKQKTKQKAKQDPPAEEPAEQPSENQNTPSE